METHATTNDPGTDAGPQPPTPSSPAPALSQRISWWALLAMVLLVPLMMSDYTLPGFATRLTFGSGDIVKLSVEIVLGLVALGAWAWGLLRHGGRIRHSPVDWLILAWLTWVGLTTITATHWPTALFGAPGRHEGLIAYLTYALVYFLVLQFADSPIRVRQLAQILSLTGVIVACYGLLQYAGVVSVPEDVPWGDSHRVFSTLGQPTMLGGFLIFTIAASVGLALHETRKALRVVYWSGFGLNGLALIACVTRSAWAGTVVCLALLGVMAWRRRSPIRRADWAPIGAFIAAAAVLIWHSLSHPGQPWGFGARVATTFSFSSGSGHSRIEIWRAAADLIGERPLLGWGADTFKLVFSRFAPAEWLRSGNDAQAAENAHNLPLQLAGTVGIVGALLCFAVFAWVAARSFKTVFARAGDATRIIVGAFWAAAAGYLVHLMLGLSVVGTTFLLWMALAIVLAPTARAKEVRAYRGGTAAAAVVLVLVTLGVAGQGIVLAADRAYMVATEEFSTRSFSDRAAQAKSAVRLNPLSSDYRSGVGSVYLEELSAMVSAAAQARARGEDATEYEQALDRSFADAEAAYKDAIDFTPDDYANYVNLAAVYLAGATSDPDRYEGVVTLAGPALKAKPLGIEFRERLARALLGLGRTDEAIEALERCMEIAPGDATAALALADVYQDQGRTAEALELLRSVEQAAPGQDGVASMIELLESAQPAP